MNAWIDDVTESLSLPSRTAYALRLCLEEAVTNIIDHAFEPGTVHEVQIALRIGATDLEAEIIDDGRVFDPLAYELPAAPKDLASVPIGGLGIKLMRSFADRVTYWRCGGANHLMLSFPLR